MDDATEPFLGRFFSFSAGVLKSSLHRAGQQDHFGVEFSFVPEMIIHGCQVDAGPFGNGANGSAFKAFFSENLAGGIQNFFAGAFLAGFNRDFVSYSSYHSATFKQVFEAVKQMF